ncbi:MAG: FAD-binding oxidoreductase [Clostridia bacterium]|nr:FAD-binding oxidoreductase [Clostridia bacterium]
MELIRDLANISGEKNVLSEPDQLKPYLSDLSLVPEGTAQAVVCPANSDEVSRIVKYCNENRLPVVPVSSAVHLYGSSIPKQGGVIVDLKRMNKILEIDMTNRCVRFEAGVTWEQLTEALKAKGMRVIMPLAPWGDRSVATDHLEREVTTNTVYDYGEPMQSVEVVFPNGDIFRTGSASVHGYPDTPSRGTNPAGPGLDFYRLLQNAQGTFGIVTWMSLKIQSIPKLNKVYFAPLKTIDQGARAVIGSITLICQEWKMPCAVQVICGRSSIPTELSVRCV